MQACCKHAGSGLGADVGVQLTLAMAARSP